MYREVLDTNTALSPILVSFLEGLKKEVRVRDKTLVYEYSPNYSVYILVMTQQKVPVSLPVIAMSHLKCFRLI